MGFEDGLAVTKEYSRDADAATLQKFWEDGHAVQSERPPRAEKPAQFEQPRTLNFNHLLTDDSGHGKAQNYYESKRQDIGDSQAHNFLHNDATRSFAVGGAAIVASRLISGRFNSSIGLGVAAGSYLASKAYRFAGRQWLALKSSGFF